MEFVLDLVIDRSLIKEGLKGIIWTIFFHRLFGPITPGTEEFLDTTYPIANDMMELNSLIEDKVNHLAKKAENLESVESNIENNERVFVEHMTIRFYDKKVTKSKKKIGWFGQGRSSETDDINPWETWVIKVKLLPVSEAKKDSRSDKKESSLMEENQNITSASFRSNLKKIIDISDTHKDHIPPITSSESSPFPYTIDTNGEDSGSSPYEQESWGKYIKKILD